MKKILVISSFILLSCQDRTKEVEITVDPVFDSLIVQSEKNISNATKLINEGDSSISNKIEKTAKKIDKLEKEVQKLKKENNELKSNLDDANDVGRPFNIRSISND